MRLGQSPIDSIKLRVLCRVSFKVTYLVYKLSVLPNNDLNKLLSIAEKKKVDLDSRMDSRMDIFRRIAVKKIRSLLV